MDQSAISASHEPLTDLEGNLQHLKLQDCAYFLRTGTCAYGAKCRFNHPAAKSQENLSKGSIESLPERPDQRECQFFVKTGVCKFGPACWYYHPPPNNVAYVSEQTQLNFLGLPLRPSEKECSYYLQTGSCKYGTTCKFHHPEPTIVEKVQPSLSSPFDSCNGVSTLTPSAHRDEGDPSPVASLARTPFFPSTAGMPRPFSVDMVRSSPQHVQGFGLDFSQQSGYSSRVPSADGCPKLFPSISVYPHSPEHSTAGIGLARPMATILHEQTIFPERPGQPDCHHYMKTGDCKFGMHCKFHHPKDRAMSSPSGLNPMGLPLRPGKQACPYFVKHGICKFGPVCKFDHPVHELPCSPPYSPSMSSMNEEPVAPFTSDTLSSVHLGSAVSEGHLNSVTYDQATSKETISDHPN